MKNDERRITSSDVARVAGVSRATVSAYLNNTRNISTKLQAKIKAAIDELGYTPHYFARALKAKDTKTIGLIIPVLSNFYMPMLNSINKTAHENHYGFILSSSEEDPLREKQMLEIMLSKRVSGILIVPTADTNKEFLKAVDSNAAPIIQVNRRLEGLLIDAVTSNNFEATYKATMHLIEKGRKNIALIGYETSTFSSDDKKEGYKAAMKYSDLIPAIFTTSEHGVDLVAASFRSFIDSNPAIDGLICTTPTRTTAVLKVLKEKSIKIPEEVAVIGSDDSPWTDLLEVPLTVIYEKTFEMGKVAVELLIEKIKAGNKNFSKSLILEDEFVVRKST